MAFQTLVTFLPFPSPGQVKVEGIEEPLLVLVRPTAEVVNTGADAGILASLRQEWDSTVQDFREKGAVGALKDATLDAVDLVGNTAGKAVDLIGTTADKAIGGARSLIDTEPAESPETAALADASAASGQAAQKGYAMKFVDGIKSEIHGTVQDFREKGAVATFKEAAFDAVDLVGTTATTAVNGAKSVAAPLLEDFWAPGAQGAPDAGPPASQPAASPSAPASSEAPAAASPAASAAPEASAAPAASAASASAAAAPAATSAAPQAAPASASAASDRPQTQPSPKAGYASSPAKAAESAETRKSLVSMRRNMFEKPKEEPKDETKKEAQEEEEVID